MEWVIIFILGLCVGSFLNAYIFRLSRTRAELSAGQARGSVWRGRSYCPKCRKALRWYELIPVVSFIFQRGRCRGCRKRIDIQYPLVELADGFIFVLAFAFQSIPNTDYWTLDIWNFIGNWKLGIGNLVVWYLLSALLVLFVYDLRYGLVPDRVVLPAIVVVFLSTVILNAVRDPVLTATGFLALLGMIVLAVAAGAAFFALQYYFSKGRWLGAGDIRLGALMGAILGWPLVTEGIIISYLIGGAVAVFLLLFGKKKFGQTLPLGTFLILGTVITFLYGQQIWEWYWR